MFDCSLRSLRIQLLAADFVVTRRRKSVVDSLLLSPAALDPRAFDRSLRSLIRV